MGRSMNIFPSPHAKSVARLRHLNEILENEIQIHGKLNLYEPEPSGSGIQGYSYRQPHFGVKNTNFHLNLNLNPFNTAGDGLIFNM